MIRRSLLLAVALVALAASFALPVVAATGRSAVGFNAPQIAGFPAGRVALTGGGAVNLTTGDATTSGSFSCLDAVGQGPLKDCLEDQGVRWDTASLLRGTSFKCTGAAAETLKPISTSASTFVLAADFYRAGDGNDESFNAQMILSATDIAPDIDGFQNIWVQGVGCGTALVNIHAG